MSQKFVAPRKVNYLSNTELLKEIHKSKVTYSSFTDVKYRDYDMIVASVDEITPEAIEAAIAEKARKAIKSAREAARLQGFTTSHKDYRSLSVDPTTYKAGDITFRVMTYDHIPLAPGRIKIPKKTSDHHVLVNFAPFAHYSFDDAGELQLVGKSHWQGDLEQGCFSQDHGRITNGLGRAFKLLTDRYSQRSNWRGYSYNEEMRGQALLQLCRFALKFDESKSDNPFSYYTVLTNNSFIAVLNAEKREATILDDQKELLGVTPSMARQLRNEGH